MKSKGSLRTAAVQLVINFEKILAPVFVPALPQRILVPVSLNFTGELADDENMFEFTSPPAKQANGLAVSFEFAWPSSA